MVQMLLELAQPVNREYWRLIYTVEIVQAIWEPEQVSVTDGTEK